MKKLLMLMVCCFMAMPAFAACNGPVTLGFRGQKPDANEFLYETKTEYELTKNGYENSGGYNSGDGHGYECDQPDGKNKIASCVHRDVVSMPAGHVFKGEVINRAVKYQCRAGSATVDDRWVVVDDGFCDTRGFGQIPRGECVKDNTGMCKKLLKTECSAYEKTDDDGTWFQGWCQETSEKGSAFKCVAIECDSNKGLIADKYGKCVKQTAVEVAEQTAKEKEKADQQAAIDADAAAARQRIARQKACEESGGSFDGKQCSCFTEKNQKFDGVEKCICITDEYRFDNKDTGCVITDNAARERLCKMAGADAFWNGSECRCYDKDKVFVEGKTACEKPDYIIKCEKSKGAYWDSDLKECLCTVEGYVWNKKDACEKGAGLVAQEIQAEEERTRKRIADLTKDLFGKYNEMVSDVSEWKNKEGEFNTARLASDSIAGVVLGTAGGLITSKVVKKSQVKSGFEDVQCTIGGQKVSDWGDEFTVGIQ